MHSVTSYYELVVTRALLVHDVRQATTKVHPNQQPQRKRQGKDQGPDCRALWKDNHRIRLHETAGPAAFAPATAARKFYWQPKAPARLRFD